MIRNPRRQEKFSFPNLCLDLFIKEGPLKILYITLENLFLHKGSVIHIKEVVTGLQNRGHQVGLIGLSSSELEGINHFYNIYHQFLNHKGISLFISSILLFFYIFRIVFDYDIIYARDYHTVIIAYLPRLIFNKRLVFEINGLANEERRLKRNSIFNRLITFFIKKLEMLATKHSDRIVSVTPYIASYLINKFHCKSNKIEVITNGVDTKKFYPINDKALIESWKKRLGIAQEDMVVVFVGNLAPWQGLEYLIQVSPYLLEKVKNIKFLIVGDGILKEEYQEKVCDLGASNHFIFTGMIAYEQIPFYINIADICVLPKRRMESGYSPIKLYEYMACGKSVVSSRVEGLEFIEEEGVGLLVEPENLKSLEEALLVLLKDPQKRIKMGQIGYKIAKLNFDWNLKVDKIENILIGLA